MSTRRSLLAIVRALDSFDGHGATPLIVDGVTLGRVRNDVAAVLRECHGDVFECRADRIAFAPTIAATFEARSAALHTVVTKWRSEDRFSAALRGWRDEKCPIFTRPFAPNITTPLAFEIERSAVGLFGLPGYGVHLNGYVRDESSGHLRMWIARRSRTKSTYPGMLDNVIAGGLPTGMALRDNLLREAEEEAGIGPDIIRRAISAGAINYISQNERGIHSETQYIFDLEMRPNEVPEPRDGEVEMFYLLPMEEVLARLEEFKPNCAVIVIHFAIRHGVITPDDEPDYLEILQYMTRRH